MTESAILMTITITSGACGLWGCWDMYRNFDEVVATFRGMATAVIKWMRS